MHFGREVVEKTEGNHFGVNKFHHHSQHHLDRVLLLGFHEAQVGYIIQILLFGKFDNFCKRPSIIAIGITNTEC